MRRLSFDVCAAEAAGGCREASMFDHFGERGEAR
jgi:hypothetical protein